MTQRKAQQKAKKQLSGRADCAAICLDNIAQLIRWAKKRRESGEKVDALLEAARRQASLLSRERERCVH